MPFDPTEFYDQAGRWFAAAKDEATLRSVVSRAYYAALLAARSKAGIADTSAKTHEITVNFYRTGGSAIHTRIAARLDNMRIARNHADYELSRICVAREAGESLKYSQKVLVDVASLR